MNHCPSNVLIKQLSHHVSVGSMGSKFEALSIGVLEECYQAAPDKVDELLFGPVLSFRASDNATRSNRNCLEVRRATTVAARGSFPKNCLSVRVDTKNLTSTYQFHTTHSLCWFRFVSKVRSPHPLDSHRSRMCLPALSLCRIMLHKAPSTAAGTEASTQPPPPSVYVCPKTRTSALCSET